MTISYLLKTESGEDELRAGQYDGAHYLTFWSMVAPYSNGRLRFHLGQLYVIQLLNKLSSLGCKTSAIICDSESQTHSKDRAESIAMDKEVLRGFLARNLAATNVVFLSEMIEAEKRINNTDFKLCHDRLLNALNEFRVSIPSENLSPEVKKVLRKYREPELKSDIPECLQPLVRSISRSINMPAHFLLPIIYAFKTRPAWLEVGGLADTAAFLMSYHSREIALGNQIILIEARRNAYPWLILQAAYRHAYPEHDHDEAWPLMGFLNNVPSLKGVGYMNSDEVSSVLYLDSTDKELKTSIKRYPASALGAVDKMFCEQAIQPPKGNKPQERLFNIICSIRQTSNDYLFKSKFIATPLTANAASSAETIPQASKHFTLTTVVLLIAFLFVLYASVVLFKQYGILYMVMALCVTFVIFVTVGSFVMTKMGILKPKHWDGYAKACRTVLSKLMSRAASEEE